MTLSPRLAGLMAAAFMLMAPALAHASDPTCLWGAVPGPVRDSFQAKYDAGDPAGGLQVIMNDNEALGAVVTTCGIKADTGQAAGKALAGYAVREAAARTLQSKYGIAPARLERAWAGQTPAARQAFAASVDAGNVDNAFVETIAKGLGLTTDDAFNHLRYWLASQSMVVAMDGQY